MGTGTPSLLPLGHLIFPLTVSQFTSWIFHTVYGIHHDGGQILVLFQICSLMQSHSENIKQHVLRRPQYMAVLSLLIDTF